MNENDLKETFSHFDSDNNGSIDFGEFDRLLSALDSSMSDDERRIGFDAIDTDKSGVIEFDEFYAWFKD